MNEVAPAVASAAQLIIKNLPLVLKALTLFIDALKSDQINDNSEKIDLLTKFGELGEQISNMFKDMKT